MLATVASTRASYPSLRRQQVDATPLVPRVLERSQESCDAFLSIAPAPALPSSDAHRARHSGASPLEYPRSAEVQRFALWSPELVTTPFVAGDAYFAETSRTIRRSPTTGRPLRRPRVETTPGAPPGTLAFVDWHRTAPDAIYIDFLKVRRDLRGQGFGGELIDRFYADVVGASGTRAVDWGDVTDDAAWALYQRARGEHPDVYHHARLR